MAIVTTKSNKNWHITRATTSFTHGKAVDDYFVRHLNCKSCSAAMYYGSNRDRTMDVNTLCGIKISEEILFQCDLLKD